MERAEGRPVVVSTGAANVPALALYESAGFTRTRQRTAPGGIRVVDLCRA